ncbi:COP9 signalosome subunit CSN8 [Penicillium sp. IBT 16267x]|nr:COP9 signalosome subunit CSN8 [Penicillium sp. IBT 16267x]
MELPPPSIEQLSKLAASNLPPSQLFQILSQYETDSRLVLAGNGDEQLLSLFYSTFFFAHLLTNQVPEARALSQRMPNSLRHQDPYLQSCLTLLRAVWQTQHDQIYQILRNLPWSEGLQPLVRRYESAFLAVLLLRKAFKIDIYDLGFFQDQTLIAVSTSYEAMRLATAATYLGLDVAAAEQGNPAVIKKFTDCGWKWDAETKLLHPTPIVLPSVGERPLNGIRDAMTLLGNRYR